MQGFIFRCNEKTFQECLDRNLFGELENYLPLIKQINTGSTLFLYNTSNWNLYGVFKAASKGDKHIEPQAWGGKFPLQVPMAISKLQKEQNVSFHEAFEKLVEEKAIIFVDEKA